MTYKISQYEEELRKLVHCEDNPKYPITPYERDRERVYKVFKSEYLKTHETTTLNPNLSEDTFYTLVEESFYRAVEQVAIHCFPDAHEALGYKENTDGRVYEMFSRIKEKYTREWEPHSPAALSEVDEIASIISRHALFLFFGTIQATHTPSRFTRWLNSTSDSNPLEKELIRIFPEKGYTAVGINNIQSFLRKFSNFRNQTALFIPDLKSPYMSDIHLINPDPKVIENMGINFFSLSSNAPHLRHFLECCLKEEGTKYAKTAIAQQYVSNFKNGSVLKAMGINPTQTGNGQTDTETECLRKEIKRLTSETETLQNTVKEKDNAIIKLQEKNDTLQSELQRKKGIIPNEWQKALKEKDDIIKTQRNKIKTLERTSTKLAEEKEKVKKTQQVKIGTLKKELKESIKEINSLRRIVGKEYTYLQGKFLSLYENHKSSVKKYYALRGDIRKLKKEIQNSVDEENPSLSEEINALKEENSKLKEELESLNKKNQALSEEASSLKEENQTLKEEIASGQYPYLSTKEAGVLDKIISDIHNHERFARDNGVIGEWMQIETKLMDIFDNVPEIKEAIRQMRNDRSRMAKEQKKNGGTGSPLVHIEQNHGPIVTGNADRKLLKPTDE